MSRGLAAAAKASPCDGRFISAPPEQTYFALYGVAERFALDADDLKRRHEALQRSVHPDLYAGRPAGERRLAEQYAATLNEAYAVLADDVRRAAYLLRLRGCDPFDEAGGHQQLPADFLERQLELREILDELAGDGRRAQLAELGTQLAGEIQAEFAALGELLDGAPKQVQPAVDAVLRLRYLQNCARQIDAQLAAGR